MASVIENKLSRHPLYMLSTYFLSYWDPTILLPIPFTISTPYVSKDKKGSPLRAIALSSSSTHKSPYDVCA